MIIGILYIVILIITLCNSSKTLYIDDDSYLFFTPNYLYKNSEMNIFGCYICSLLIIIFDLLYCVPVIIGWVIWKLFHIGRKID